MSGRLVTLSRETAPASRPSRPFAALPCDTAVLEPKRACMLPTHILVLVGIGGTGAGLLLARLVDRVGARRGAPRSDHKMGKHHPAWTAAFSLGVALALVGLAAGKGGVASALRRGALALVLAGSAWADARWGIVPNELTGLGVVLGAGLLAVGFVPEGTSWKSFVGAGIGASGLLFLFRIGAKWSLGRPGFGMGDVKLGAVLGLYIGWKSLWAVYLAVLCAGVAGGVGLLAGGLSRGDRLPFAPFLALGTALHWLVLPTEVAIRWASVLWLA